MDQAKLVGSDTISIKVLKHDLNKYPEFAAYFKMGVISEKLFEYKMKINKLILDELQNNFVFKLPGIIIPFKKLPAEITSELNVLHIKTYVFPQEIFK